jgi:hypothetical protein
MTETTTAQVGADPVTEPAETTPDAPAEPTPEPAPAVEHTPGGLPALPLALSGANAAAGLAASAALVGGPITAALAMTGAAVLGTAAARRNRTATNRKAAGKSATGRSRSRMPGQRAGTGRTTVSAGGRTGRKSTGAATRSGAAKTGRKGAGKTQASRSAGARAGHASAGGGKRAGHGGRAGQVKALRNSQRNAAPTRAERRAQTTAARRGLADARRAAKSQARAGKASGRGPVGRSLAKAAGKARAAQRAAIGRSRAARDRAAAGRVDASRSAVRKAPARRAARKALRRSAARFQGRRVLAALLGGALGLVGLLTTPLGRKLGWLWLQYPGRRLYRALSGRAAAQRAERDAQIHDQREQAEAAVDAEAADDGNDGIGDTAQRPQGPTATSTDGSTTEGEHVSGFRFEEYAAEMESAAQSYDPDDAMEILAMVEGLPAALTSIANVMKTLAERADSEFPLEKEVADGFNDIFGAVSSAVAVAEDMGPLFRQAHEQDIARHEDPRNGPEAEKGWNV